MTSQTRNAPTKATRKELKMSIGMKIARYANENWKGCFSEEELKEFAYDYETDADTLEDVLKYIAEDIDNAREEGFYDDEAISLYNEGKELLKKLTA